MLLKTSIVVPVYNEADIVADLLDHLRGLGAWETIVVDGGSTDGTWEKLDEREPGSVALHQSGKGRALQMNSGALRATGDVLLFLHADTRLPDGALALISEALKRAPGDPWGRFDVRFDRAGPRGAGAAAASSRPSF